MDDSQPDAAPRTLEDRLLALEELGAGTYLEIEALKILCYALATQHQDHDALLAQFEYWAQQSAELDDLPAAGQKRLQGRLAHLRTLLEELVASGARA